MFKDFDSIFVLLLLYISNDFNCLVIWIDVHGYQICLDIWIDVHGYQIWKKRSPMVNLCALWGSWVYIEYI